jgi:hypothetical protein
MESPVTARHGSEEEMRRRGSNEHIDGTESVPAFRLDTWRFAMTKQTSRKILVDPGAILSMFFLSAVSVEAVGEKPQEDLYKIRGRPKVSLVLSGGGARGVAHVGLFKVLEKLRVPVDFIAGTSMGSRVGGICASGMSPEDSDDRGPDSTFVLEKTVIYCHIPLR